MIRSAMKLIAIPMAALISLSSVAQDLPLDVADLPRTEPVDFATEIMPLLKRNCLACHHEKEAEGGLVLESAASLRKGGDSGSGVNIESPLDSLLLLRATGKEEPLMPPDDNSVGASTLTPDELGLLKLWIAQGAQGSHGGTAMSESIEWQEIPESVRTSLALAVAPDGQVAALGRGNRIVVVDLATFQPTGLLVDATVLGGNAAHVDLVQSIAISPDAQRIASGGFRTVKIWKKQAFPLDETMASLAGSGGLVAVKPDESAVAIVNAIGDIELWNVAQSQKTASLRGHADRVSSLAWAKSADRLASCDATGRVILWQASSGEKLQERETGAVLVQLAISDDGQQLAGVDFAGGLHRMQISADGAGIETLAQLPEGLTRVTCAVFASQPNPLLIVADESAGVMVVSLADLQVLRKIEHGSAVDALAISSDQTRLFTGGRDGKTRVWDLNSGESVVILEGDPRGRLQHGYARRAAERQKAKVERLNGETAELEKRLTSENEVVTKATEEHQKATASLEESERKRAEAAALALATEQSIAKANDDATRASQLVESAQEKLAASTTLMESLQKELDANTAELATTKADAERLQTQIATLAKALEEANARSLQVQEFADAKNRELTTARESAAAVKSEIDTATKLATDSKATAEKAAKELAEQQKSLAGADEARAKSEAELAKRQQALNTASQAQTRAAAAIPDHKIAVDAETRRQGFLDQQLSDTERRLADRNQQILSVAVSHDDKSVASMHGDGSIRVYRLDNGQPTAGFDSEPSSLSDSTSQVAWFGSQVIAYRDAAPPQIWSTRFGWMLERSIGSIDDSETISDRVTAIDFRQDGLTIAIGSGPPSRSGEVKVFAVETGELVRDFGEVHSDSVLGLAFSPLGQFIASSGADKTIRLLDVASGSVTRSLEGHTHHVLSIAWQDDGRSIASASADRTIKVWDAETGEQRRTISGFGKEITAIEFVSATNQLATACADGQVRLYDASNGKSIRTFNAEGDFLFAMRVSQDGTILYAAGQSGVLRGWKVEDGKLVAELK